VRNERDSGEDDRLAAATKIHEHPELGAQEFRDFGFCCAAFATLGLECVRRATTGVVAIPEGRQAGVAP